MSAASSASRRFQSAPEFTLGGNGGRRRHSLWAACFNPPPSSHSGETQGVGPAQVVPDQFQSAPEFTLGGNAGHRLQPPGRLVFQSAPEFTLGGNPSGRSGRRPPGRFNPPPSSHSGETGAVAFSRLHADLFQSAPEFTLGGNPRGRAGRGRCAAAVSIRPRVHTRGKRRLRPPLGRRLRVSIRPRVHTRGKHWWPGPPAGRPGCFNPPPSSHSGETVGNVTRDKTGG